MITSSQRDVILNAVDKASARWKTAFNAENAQVCVDQYENDAVMHARPFGTFTGIAEIKSFWQKLIDDGFSGVEYIKPRIEIFDEKSAILTSGWKMNKARGIIHKELWILQENGTAKLRADDFKLKTKQY
jgi:ketosteroid isomerase-like protein